MKMKIAIAMIAMTTTDTTIPNIKPVKEKASSNVM
jgi:hypothetical protein